MNTESRRKAALTYKAKLAAAGYRQKAFRFSPETVADLERLAKAAELTEANYIAKLIAEAAQKPVEPPKPEKRIIDKVGPVTDPATGAKVTSYEVQVGPAPFKPRLKGLQKETKK